MLVRERDQEHFTRAELAFTFARADSLARDLPIVDISPVPHGQPWRTTLPSYPIGPVEGEDSEPTEGEDSPLQLRSFTREECPYVYDLIKRHRSVWESFINHPFPKQLADGSASLDQFRYYMIQDFLYIQGYIRDKMMGASRADFTTLEMVTQKLPSSVRYAQDVNDMCVYELGVPQDTINNTLPSESLTNCRAFHSSVAQKDDWFALHIAILPCIIGYYEMAITIIGDSKTARNTVYHTLWTVLNADKSYVQAYLKFVNDNLERYSTSSEATKRWDILFGEACELEMKFFDIEPSLSLPYDIVRPGTYKVINFWNGCALDTNAPSDDYWKPFDRNVDIDLRVKAPRTPLFIYTAPESNSNSQKWILKPTKNGYTLQNTATKEYASATDDKKGRHKVVSSMKEAFWWINPMNSKFECAPTKYQFFVASSIQRTLEASEDSVNINAPWPTNDRPPWPSRSNDPNDSPIVYGSDNQQSIVDQEPLGGPFSDEFILRLLRRRVFASMNHKGTSQMWILEEIKTT